VEVVPADVEFAPADLGAILELKDRDSGGTPPARVDLPVG
jgi:hypothetical protein